MDLTQSSRMTWPTLARWLPPWARFSNPVLRYIINRERRRFSPGVRVFGILLGLALLASLVYFSIYLENDQQLEGISSRGESLLYTLAYVPLLLIQFAFVGSGFSLVLALGLTSPLVPLDQQREAWELVKMTSHGAELTLRSRWVGVFYYMPGPLIMMLVLRLIFVLDLLIDLLTLPGAALDRYSSGMIPAVAPEIALIGVVVFALAGLIQPFVMLGFISAISLYLSSTIGNRLVLRLTLALSYVGQMIAFSTAGILAAAVFGADLNPWVERYLSNDVQWAIMLAFGLIGDHGLYFLDLPAQLQLWRDVDYGLLIGPVIALVVIIEMLLTRVLLRAIIRRGVRPARE